MALNYWTRLRWKSTLVLSEQNNNTKNTVLHQAERIHVWGQEQPWVQRDFPPKALQNTRALPCPPFTTWSTREYYTALAEHLQECKTQVKENTGTNLAWPQPIYFKACYLSFGTSIRTVFTSHSKAPLSHKNPQVAPEVTDAPFTIQLPHSLYLVKGTKINIKVLIKRKLKLLLKLQDDAVSHSQCPHN